MRIAQQLYDRRGVAHKSIWIAYGQGLFYLITGLWSLVHMRSFERVTGSKTDTWLVKTVGLLLALVGALLVRAARRGAINGDLRWLGAGSAAVLAGIDITYVARGRIPQIYLLDAVAELAFTLGWVRAGLDERSHTTA